MDVQFEPHLRVGDVIVDGDDAALLAAIDDHGSLNAAADALGRSYARTHARLIELEAALGTLVDRERGGTGGGGSELTPSGRVVRDRFDRLEASLAERGDEDGSIDGRVVTRDGRLATVETAAGPIRVVDVGETTHVTVSIPADAVGLHGRFDAPGAGSTTVRNHLTGEITSVDRHDGVASVSVSVGPDCRLSAVVTGSGFDRLGLDVGSGVVVSFTATATRVRPAE